MKPVRILLAVAAMASTSSSCGQGLRWKLEVSSSSVVAQRGFHRIEMQAGETTIVELLVLGAVPDRIVFGSADLPAFATLQGSVLKLSPGRRDGGEYRITVSATNGADSQTALLDLVVHRNNSPPTWSGNVWFYDDHGFRDLYCPGSHCVADGTVRLGVLACDAEGDGIRLDVEVISRGQAFSRMATDSSSVPSGYADPTLNSPVGNCTRVDVSLTGLTKEQSYEFAVRVSDEFGAAEDRLRGQSNGWISESYWSFDQGPCIARTCACLPSGIEAFCNGRDYVCCSGKCIWNWPAVPSCQ